MARGEIEAGGATDGVAEEVEVALENGGLGVEGLRKAGEGSLGGGLDSRRRGGTLAIAIAGVIDEQEAAAGIGRRIKEVDPIEGEGAVAREDDPEMPGRLIREQAGRKVEGLLGSLRSGVGKRDEKRMQGGRAGGVAARMIDEEVLEKE